MTDANITNNGENAIPMPIPLRTSMASSGNTSRRSSTETRTTRTGHSTTSTRTKDRHKTSTSSRELAVLYAVEKHKSESLQLSLDEAHRELAAQRRRIEEAETNLLEVTSAFMKANKERLEALHDAAVATEERELYRLQLSAAQSDIDKAHHVVRTIDQRRVKAEEDAAKYQRSARELREKQLILAAREEGRRVGFREGLQRARAEVGFLDIDQTGYVTPPNRNPLESLSDVDEDRSTIYSDEIDEPISPPRAMPSEPPSVRERSPDIQPQPLPRSPPPRHTPAPAAPPRPSSRSTTATGQIHPIPYHNIPPSPRHPPVNIPPDGMIPLDSSDGNGIVLPPPHELSPMPPIMELSPAPAPPPVIEEEEPRIVPPPGSHHRSPMYASHPDYHPGHSYRGQSSPESSSTAMSQFDMLAEPQSMMANLSPMSAIPEVASGFTSPNVPSMQGGDLHRSGSMRSTASPRRSPSPIPVPPVMQTPRSQPQAMPDVNVNYYAANTGHQRVGHKQSVSSMTSSKRAKSPPTSRSRPYSPPQIANIYTNPHYQNANDAQEYARNMPPERDGGRRSKTPTQRSYSPYGEEQQQASFIPPTPSYIPHTSSQEPLRKPSRKASMTSAGSSSRADTRHQSRSPPVVSPPTAGIYTTLAPPDAQIEAHSPQSSSSGDYSVKILSPTPPGSAHNVNMEGSRRPLNEFLSAKDAERPMPMPGSPRAQSPSPRLHPIGLSPDDDVPLQTAPFGSPSIGTPIALGGGGIFVPSAFTPGSNPNASSALPDSGGSYNSLGMPTSSHRPVIPDPSLLGPADSDTDSESRVSSGMNSEANTLTTPPTVARGLPAQRARANSRGGKAATKKKRR